MSLDYTVIAQFQGSDVVIALLAVTGAVIAALVAAHSAKTRQREQLADDRERADVAELRSVLDEAAITLGEAEDALLAASAELDVFVNVDSDAAPLRAIHPQLAELYKRVSRHAARIALRVGRDSDVYRTYRDAEVAMLNATAPFAGYGLSTPTADDLAKLKRHRSDVEDAHREFLEVAELVVGSRVSGVEKTVAEQLDEVKKT